MNAAEEDATRSREEHYHEVSLRAVELLAKAQRAADEAVAEAQAYARDLEQSAREQYKQILLRAQAAAQHVASAEGEARGTDQGNEGGAGAEPTSALDAQQLVYVRTYARVAHAQLKSVLAALNDELDQLAAMAEGAVSGQGALVPPSTAQAEGQGHHMPPAPEPPVTDTPPGADANDESRSRPETVEGAASDGSDSTSDATWPPIFAATSSGPSVHRGSGREGPHH